MSFFDAAAPLVTFESIDMEKAWFASRYDRGDADYVNCSMDKDEYLAFVEALPNGGGSARSTDLRTSMSSRAACPWRSWPAAAWIRCATAR